ncbi:MAG TPA: DUF302 domain-containing protein [Ignavibacteriaceae bacterium]|nr:DUF302 domain-containing protein [Ignavibacteriaceae bacterium]
MEYGFSKTVDLPFDKAVEKVTDELKKVGFGVLTEIDVKETMKKKLNVDYKNYKILGACNPPIAHKALQIEEELGLLLPCNVIVYEKEGKCAVSVFNPMIMTQLIDNKEMIAIAEEVKSKLLTVLEKV